MPRGAETCALDCKDFVRGMHGPGVSTIVCSDGMAATETSTRANAALDELYRQHVGEVYRYTYAVLGNHADAEDVTQTTFVNALRALERGETPEDPAHWLVVIAHNLVRQRWRQAASRPTLVELETDVPDAADDEDGYELEELVRALQRIPETQREAIVMRELEGRSYREIAGLLGLSTSALETLLFRARRSLADELENVVTCQTAELSLSKQLDGRLSRKERRRLDEHLADCPDCARLAATQQRQRRAFKGLALLPLPIGLALFKGAPSAAAATSLPTIGLGTAGAGAHGTGVAGASAAGAGAATSAGGAVVGGSVAGGLAVKVAAIVVTATVATGVGYKGVQAVRETPSKPAPADVKPKAHAARTPATVAPTTRGKAAHAQTAHGKSAQHARGNGKGVGHGHESLAAVTPPGLAKESTRGSDHANANGVGNDKVHATGPAHAKQTDKPKPKAKPKPASAHPKRPKHMTPPTAKNDAGASTQTPPAPPVTTPPASGEDTATPPASPADDTATSGDTGAPAGSGATGGTSAPVTQPPPTPPATGGSTTPTSPVTTPPPSGSTEGGPSSSNNGADNGKKLGHYQENQDGKHL
jgi:RNA polymerase sigma factor (sigma-70 family)